MSCQFIPPFVLQRLIDTAPRGTPHSEQCRTTLVLDERLRAERRGGAPRHPTSASAPSTTGPQRTIHDAHNTEELPGIVVRDGDQSTGDAAVDEAWNSSAAIWDLFAEVFDRRSVDGAGTPLVVTVHYGTDYDNAFWNGSQLVFGDGGGEVFGRFTEPIDVLAHEFTHGVTEHTAALDYTGQSGALNESLSDVFASMCKQRSLGQTVDRADWLIGQGIFLPGVHATALRSMKEPGTAFDDPRLGKDPQVGSMADYVDTSEDNGGVHINSGIPNRAFCLAAIALGGHSWEQAGPIWYRALTGGQVRADTDFAGFARATVTAAAELFGPDSPVADQVRQAWGQVGLDTGTAGPAATTSATDPQSSVTVRRHGGFAGITRTARIDTESDQGRRLRSLFERLDLTAIPSSPPRPDRFSYTVQYADREFTLSEDDLPAEVHEALAGLWRRPRSTQS